MTYAADHSGSRGEVDHSGSRGEVRDEEQLVEEHE